MQTDIGLIAHGAATISALGQLWKNIREWALDGVGDTLGYANRFNFSGDGLLHSLCANTNLSPDGRHGYFWPALP